MFFVKSWKKFIAGELNSPDPTLKELPIEKDHGAKSEVFYFEKETFRGNKRKEKPKKVAVKVSLDNTPIVSTFKNEYFASKLAYLFKISTPRLFCISKITVSKDISKKISAQEQVSGNTIMLDCFDYFDYPKASFYVHKKLGILLGKIHNINDNTIDALNDGRISYLWHRLSVNKKEKIKPQILFSNLTANLEGHPLKNPLMVKLKELLKSDFFKSHTLIHGDFYPNITFNETNRQIAVIDWEDSFKSNNWLPELVTSLKNIDYDSHKIIFLKMYSETRNLDFLTLMSLLIASTDVDDTYHLQFLKRVIKPFEHKV